jgi:RNA polymerase sigma-70 factor (ECF subfamily)
MSPSDEDPAPPAGAGAAEVPATLEAAALAGDAEAWAALIRRDNHRVLVALLARGVPLDEARELAQETWMRLMERQRAGRLVSLTLPGLAIVQAGFFAANLKRRPGTVAVGPEDGGLRVRQTPEDDAIGRQRLAVLSRALADCPPSARRVFTEVYDHPELGYGEIAARVGLSVQRVKQIVFEVRKRLRAALAEGEGR